MRITVYDVLSYLAAGTTQQEILADFPYLTVQDILAALSFAEAQELRPEYDEALLTELLKNRVRGKYVERFRQGTNWVKLAPDVAAAFPTKNSVNEALQRVLASGNRAA